MDYTVRDEKGNEWKVSQENLQQAEADGFLPVVSDGSQEHRVSSADLPTAAKDGFSPLGHEMAEEEEDSSFLDKFNAATESFERGAIPFSDEISAGLDSISPVHTLLGQEKPSYEEALASREEQVAENKKDIGAIGTVSEFAGEVANPVNRLIGAGLGKALGAGAKKASAAAKSASGTLANNPAIQSGIDLGKAITSSSTVQLGHIIASGGQTLPLAIISNPKALGILRKAADTPAAKKAVETAAESARRLVETSPAIATELYKARYVDDSE